MELLVSKRKYLCIVLLLLAVATVSMLVRYPQSQHETGVDSFYIQALGLSITEHGYARWTIHPLSYFGLYPYSQPSAVPFTLSEMGQVMGTGGEETILLISFLYGALAALFMFILVREVFGDWRAGVAGGFFYTICPAFVNLSTWSTSTRNLFLVLFPIVLWMFIKLHAIRAARGRILPHAILVLPATVALLASHRLGIFIFPLIVAYAISAFLVRFPVMGFIRDTKTKRKWAGLASGVLIIAALAAIILIQNTDYIGFYQGIRWEINRSYPDQQTAFHYLYNIMKSYGQALGLGFFFLPIGLGYVVFRAKKTFSDMFLILCFMASLSILIVPTYATDWIAPIACIFIGFGAIAVFKVIRRYSASIAGIAVCGVVISSCAVTGFVIDYWSDQPKFVQPGLDEQTYITTIYVKYSDEGRGYLANRIDTSNRLQGFGVSCTPAQDPMALVYGYVNADTLVIIENPIERILEGKISLYTTKGNLWDNPTKAWYDYTVRYSDTKNVKMRNTYNVWYLLETENAFGMVVNEGKGVPSPYISNAHDTSYKIYHVEGLIIWRA